MGSWQLTANSYQGLHTYQAEGNTSALYVLRGGERTLQALLS